MDLPAVFLYCPWYFQSFPHYHNSQIKLSLDNAKDIHFMTKSSALTTKCDGSAALSCVNEPHVFVVLFGAFAGAAAWHHLHFGNGNLVSFPDVEQRGMAQIRLKFWGICRGSLFRVTR